MWLTDKAFRPTGKDLMPSWRRWRCFGSIVIWFRTPLLSLFAASGMMLCVWRINFCITVNTPYVSLPSKPSPEALFFGWRCTQRIIYINRAGNHESRYFGWLWNCFFWTFKHFLIDRNATYGVQYQPFVISLLSGLAQHMTFFHVISTWVGIWFIIYNRELVRNTSKSNQQKMWINAWVW